MRTPRLEAFDSKASQRTPEDVDLVGMVPLKDRKETILRPSPTKPSEDHDSSPPTPTERKSARISDRSEVRTEQRTEFRPEERTPLRTSDLPLKRRTKRYSFEFYEDQLVKLKQLKIQAEMAGESVSLSEMARLALDAYLRELET